MAIARTRSGWGASRDNIMAQLIAERMTGQPQESFTNAAMRWGTETEPQARAMYEIERGVDVVEVGLYRHQTIAGTHASPDGLVGDDGLVEIKCPNTATHIDTLLSQSIDGKYITQMQWQMACAGRAWCDFVSFDSRMPADLQMWVRRVERDDKVISDLEELVAGFIRELENKLARLESLRMAME
jgi:putative phage-type endonuclease